MDNILISIVVPVYNRADCISKCIESVVSQITDEYELVIVNDGSTDDTLSIVKQYENEFPALKVITYENNKGVNYARNRGVEAACGQFILFLDSDDTLAPDSAGFITGVIQANPDFKHILFMVDDNATSRPAVSCVYTYKDWLGEKVGGDFAHLLAKQTLSDNPFDEDFRIYESLNWLRIMKQNRQQLFIPRIAINRDRNRPDSVSKEYMLQNKKSIRQEYNFRVKYIDLYEKDLSDNNLNCLLEKNLQRAVLLGISSGEVVANKPLIEKLKGLNSSKVFALSLFNKTVFSSLLYFLIKLKSKVKYGSV